MAFNINNLVRYFCRIGLFPRGILDESNRCREIVRASFAQVRRAYFEVKCPDVRDLLS